MDSLKFSIIIPAYNIQDEISASMKSALLQSYPEFEVFVIDDGSTDGTVVMAEQIAAGDIRISILKTEHHGVSAARNKGLALASGDYIIFLDGDDTLSLDALEQISEVTKKFQNPEIIQFAIARVEKQILKTSCTEYLPALEAEEGGVVDAFSKGNIFPSVCNKAWKRECIKRLSFDTSVSIGEDLLFVMEASFVCWRYVMIRRELYYYYQRNTSVINNKNPDRLERNYREIKRVVSSIACRIPEGCDNRRILCIAHKHYLRHLYRLVVACDWGPTKILIKRDKKFWLDATRISKAPFPLCMTNLFFSLMLGNKAIARKSIKYFLSQT